MKILDVTNNETHDYIPSEKMMSYEEAQMPVIMGAE